MPFSYDIRRLMGTVGVIGPRFWLVRCGVFKLGVCTWTTWRECNICSFCLTDGVKYGEDEAERGGEEARECAKEGMGDEDEGEVVEEGRGTKWECNEDLVGLWLCVPLRALELWYEERLALLRASISSSWLKKSSLLSSSSLVPCTWGEPLIYSKINK